MIRPTAGLKCFHNGKPVELMYVIRTVEGSHVDCSQVWLVRPLFVANPVTRPELFSPGDRLTLLHTQSA